MKLTTFTYYSIRVLVYITSQKDRPCSIKEIASIYNISGNHLKKAAEDLTKNGYLTTIRGRYGGFRLAKDPETITLGEIVRITENKNQIMDCYDDKKRECLEKKCPLAHVCQISSVFAFAQQTFLKVLDQFTIKEMASGEMVSFDQKTLS